VHRIVEAHSGHLSRSQVAAAPPSGGTADRRAFADAASAAVVDAWRDSWSSTTNSDAVMLEARLSKAVTPWNVAPRLRVERALAAPSSTW